MERRLTANESVDYRAMLVALRASLPTGFQPSQVNSLLVLDRGPSLFGLAAIGDSGKFLPDVERTIRYLQERIIAEPSLQTVTALEVADALKVSNERAERLLLLATSIGNFMSSASGSPHGYTSIGLGRDDSIAALLAFKDLGSLMKDRLRPPAQQLGYAGTTVSPRRKGRVKDSHAEKPEPRTIQVTRRARKELQTLFNTYRLGAKVGEGAAGTVYAATDSAGNDVAVKVLDPTKTTSERLRRFKNELSFGFRNSHRNLMPILDFGVAGEGAESVRFFVMPLYRGSLRGAMAAGIPVESALFVYSHLLEGVRAAHGKGVVHRDLKPENVLVNSWSDVVIADFGIAHFEEDALITAIETKDDARLANFSYAAPEQRKRGGRVTKAADIFALGLILNEMFTGEVPHGANFRTIADAGVGLDWIDDVVAAMIQAHPDKRPGSIDEVLDLLKIGGAVAPPSSPDANSADLDSPLAKRAQELQDLRRRNAYVEERRRDKVAVDEVRAEVRSLQDALDERAKAIGVVAPDLRLITRRTRTDSLVRSGRYSVRLSWQNNGGSLIDSVLLFQECEGTPRLAHDDAVPVGAAKVLAEREFEPFPLEDGTWRWAVLTAKKRATYSSAEVVELALNALFARIA